MTQATEPAASRFALRRKIQEDLNESFAMTKALYTNFAAEPMKSMVVVLSGCAAFLPSLPMGLHV